MLKRALFFILLLPLICFSQTSSIDSLQQLLKNTTSDSVKVITLNDLFSEYEFVDTTKAKASLTEALTISKKENLPSGLAQTYLNLGYFHEDKGDYRSAIQFYDLSANVSKLNGLKIQYADALMSLGILNEIQGNYIEALDKYNRALVIYTELNKLERIASCYNNIGLVFSSIGNYPEALKNQFAALKLREKLGQKENLSNSYCNIGVIYKRLGNNKDAMNYYLKAMTLNEEVGSKKGLAEVLVNIGIIAKDDQDFKMALTYYNRALKLHESIGDKKGIAVAYSNIGILYREQSDVTTDPVIRKELLMKALENLNHSLKIKTDLDNKPGIAGSLNGIGMCYLKLNQLDKAAIYFQKAKELAFLMNHKEYLKAVFENFAKLDSTKGDYRSALKNRQLFVLYRDSLNNDESQKKLIQSQMNYDFEKKEAVLAAEHAQELLNKTIIENEKSRKQLIVIVALVIGFVFVLLFSLFVWRTLRITRKQNSLIEFQKDELKLRKEELILQKHIIEEKQQDIIDSITYAKRIQQAMLPNQNYIYRKITQLKK